jgi:hypothetical protein
MIADHSTTTAVSPKMGGEAKGNGRKRRSVYGHAGTDSSM